MWENHVGIENLYKIKEMFVKNRNTPKNNSNNNRETLIKQRTLLMTVFLNKK